VPLQHTTMKALERRLESIEGHVRGVKSMVDHGAECEALLVQLRAISAAVEKVAALVLREHIDQCLKAAISSGDREAALRELEAVLRQLPIACGDER